MSGIDDPPPESPTGTISPAEGRGRPTAAPDFAAGRVLAGRFRIVRFMAQGGMGEVYEAEDLELNEHVALDAVASEARARGFATIARRAASRK